MSDNIIHADHGAVFIIERDNRLGLARPWELYRVGPECCEPNEDGNGNDVTAKRQTWIHSAKWKFEIEQARVVAIEKWNKIDGPAYNRRAKS